MSTARPHPASAPVAVPAWHSPDWQAAIGRAVEHGIRGIHSTLGRRPLEWLAARGIQPETVDRFRIGFLQASWVSEPIKGLGKDGSAGKLFLPRGITVPWPAPGLDPERRWIGANVHRLSPDVFTPVEGPRWQAAAGSKRAGYPVPGGFRSNVPLLVMQGELDALLAAQEFGAVVEVLTLGGTGSPSAELVAELLERCPQWLLGLANTAAGENGVEAWRRLGGDRVRRLVFPSETPNLIELTQAGVDIRAWFQAECDRLGVSA